MTRLQPEIREGLLGIGVGVLLLLTVAYALFGPRGSSEGWGWKASLEVGR